MHRALPPLAPAIKGRASQSNPQHEPRNPQPAIVYINPEF